MTGPYYPVVTDAEQTWAQPPAPREDALEDFDIFATIPAFVGARMRVVDEREWSAIQAIAERRAAS